MILRGGTGEGAALTVACTLRPVPQQVVYLRRPVVVTWGEHLQDGSVLKHAKERQVLRP